ncbi:MAG: RelA/SpoT family protein [Marinilabiliales bacterium]|nr:MAG: RelA/SpoT family protein [Marinilabiliales bacterium]
MGKDKLDSLMVIGGKPIAKKDKESIQKAMEYVEKYSPKLDEKDRLYKDHVIDVAETCIREIGLGPTSAICSLLHGLVINKIVSPETLKKDFGDNIVEILNGFIKVSSLKTERVSFQSETFSKLFLSLVDDIRVILIRLSHDLNDLRNIDNLGDRKDALIQEVKYIYTPIAHRLGLYKIKTELEERVMLYENSDIYKVIETKIQETRAKREVFIQDFIRPFERELFAQGFDFEIKWRTKSIPSIWAKMKRQNIDFDQVYDLFAIRIIINSKKPKKEKEDCWRVYSVVTNFYSPDPKRLRDWISTPKASGYESLHTTVKSQNDRYVEVQIRTKRMDEVAEKGQASHWAYKGVMNRKNTDDWLTQVRDILENPEQIQHDSAYKTGNSKANESIFVFTPKGDLKQLKAGSTVLDFAFEIHTDVGSSCQGAQVNNKVVPIRYELKNGDKVDIITSKNQKPKLDWLSFVNTERARVKIKRKLKEDKYKEAENGKELLLRKFKNWKFKSTDDLINVLVKHYKLETSVDLYYLIASEKLEIPDIKKVLQEFINKDETQIRADEIAAREEKEEKLKTQADKTDDTNDIIYIGKNLKNINYRMAKCCNPIMGDKVFGFVTIASGITIHRNNCPNAKRLKENYPYRLVQVQWIKNGEGAFVNINLKVSGEDKLGIVGSITNIITTDLKVNMRSINFTTKGKNFS